MRSTSDRRCRANRINAEKSTGPRTLAAKHITCRNAVKHGLSTPWLPTIIEVGQIEAVTSLLVSPEADKDHRFLARTLARAVVAVISTRRERDAHVVALLEKFHSSREVASEEGAVSSVPTDEGVAIRYSRLLCGSPKLLETLDLYERRRGRALKHALKAFIASEADLAFTDVEVGILDEEFHRHMEAGVDDPNHRGRFHLPRRPTIVPGRPVCPNLNAVSTEDGSSDTIDDFGASEKA